MGSEYTQSYSTLQEELHAAKNTLITLNDNIRRIVGRDSKDGLRHTETKGNEVDRGQIENGTSFKRRNLDSKSVFNRLSAPNTRKTDGDSKRRLNSRVIRELPSRQEIVAAQCTDAESRARNRRMFGSLLGTLHKFCLEESRLKPKEDKKAKIEKKLEEQELQEKETLKKERESLFMDRKRKQVEIRKIELKISRFKDFEIWESAQNHIKNNIKTKSKPHIYFKPRVLNKKTEKLLFDFQNSLNKEINEKKDIINKDIAAIEDRFKLQEERDSVHTEPRTIKSESDAINKTKNIYENNEDNGNGNISDEHIIVHMKNDLDCKENNARNVNGPTLSSSVVVVSSGAATDNKPLK